METGWIGFLIFFEILMQNRFSLDIIKRMDVILLFAVGRVCISYEQSLSISLAGYHFPYRGLYVCCIIALLLLSCSLNLSFALIRRRVYFLL